MKKSLNSAVNFIINKGNDQPYELNEILFKLVIIGFSIGMIVVIDSMVYGFLTR